MSSKTPNKPSGKENQQKEALYPVEELVYKGGYTGDPEEIVQNPAVSPQTIGTEKELRGDLRKE